MKGEMVKRLKDEAHKEGRIEKSTLFLGITLPDLNGRP